MTTFDEGFEAGQAWATAAAGSAELMRLHRSRDSLGDKFDEAIFAVGDDASHFMPAERVAFMVIRKHSPEAVDAVAFWDRVTGKGVDWPTNPMWLKGFVRGALHVVDATAISALEGRRI